MTQPPLPQAPREPIRSVEYQHWKELADAVYGITPDEPRFRPVLALLDRCEAAFTSGHRGKFLQAKEQALNYIAASTPRIKPGGSATAGTAAQSV